MSQVDLAKEAAISQSALADYELGKRKPRVDAASKLADALGVSFHWLFSDGDPDHTPSSDDQTGPLIEYLDHPTSNLVWTDREQDSAAYGRFVDGIIANIGSHQPVPRLPILLRSIRMYWASVLLTLRDLPLETRVDIAIENDRLRRVELSLKDREIEQLRKKVTNVGSPASSHDEQDT
jgi:transcriptional regulator with XRE-family HTH domain